MISSILDHYNLFSKKIASILLICFCVNGIYGQELNGTYKIGGITPDFDSISFAVDTLMKYGINGSVVFDIRDGIYEEQIVIPQIAGTNSTNTITFQSELGIASNVYITFESTESGQEPDLALGNWAEFDYNVDPENYGSEQTGNYTIILDGADYIKFNNLTIQATGINYGRVIDIRNEANYNSFTNNIIEGVDASLNSSQLSVIYSWNSSDNYNEFINNRIINGSIGINLIGEWELEWGEMEYPIMSSNDKFNIISNNSFENQKFGYISIHYHDSLYITSNKFRTNSVENDFKGILCVTSNQIKINKNDINIINSGNGIWLGASNDSCMLSNNFISIGGIFESCGIYSSESSNTKIYNNSVNIFNDNERSRAIYTGYGNYNIINNIFSCYKGYAAYISSNFAIDTINYNNFYSEGEYIGYWQGDITDIIDWKFQSSQDTNSISLNPYFTNDSNLHVFQIGLNNVGKALLEVTEDLDNEARNIISPDIGADEFTPPTIDASINKIISPEAPFLEGDQIIKISLANYGVDTITSVQINWEFKTTSQTPYDWSGVLASGDTTIIEIGTANFSSFGTSNNLKIWTNSPNNNIDGNNLNDTLEVDMSPGLNGNYTIGGTSPDFDAIRDAINSVTEFGIAGNVIFDIRPGTYNEQLIINEIPGAEFDYHITFRSETLDSSSVILTASPSSGQNFTVFLNGTDNIQFSNLTITTSGTNLGRIFDLAEDVSNFSIKNSEIQGINISDDNDEFSLIYALNNNYQLFEFSNNKFINGSMGIYLSDVDSVKIQNNIFKNQYSESINLNYITSIQISSNTITSNLNNHTGIYVSSCYDELNVKNNCIISDGGYGIYLRYSNGDETKPLILANNMISISGSYSSRGIYMYRAQYTNVLYNSIQVLDGSSSATGYYAYDSDYNVFSNNIISNTTGDGAFYLRYTSVLESDNNNFFTNDEDGFLGYWNGTNVYEIEDIPDGMNHNSWLIDPEFISNNDLHTYNVILNGKASPISNINTDIDGESRDPINPDIGADEYTPPPLNANLLSLASPVTPSFEGENDVAIKVRNDGMDTLVSLTIHWEFNDILQSPYQWAGSVNHLDTTNISIGQANLLPGQLNKLKIWLSDPNGGNDFNPKNDTIYYELYTAIQGEFTIGGISPDFENFKEAISAMHVGGISGDVKFNVRDGEYFEQVILDNIIGSSLGHSITFEAESMDSTNVILNCPTDSSENYTIFINETDNLIFKHITITTSKTYEGRLISSDGDIENLNCNGIIFNGVDTSSTSGLFTLLDIYSSDGENTRIENCIFNNGSYGIHLDSYENNPKGTYISNNNFHNQSGRGIYIHSHDSLIIHGNNINSTNKTNFYAAIETRYCSSGNITSNKINVNGSYGVYLYHHISTETPLLIANNFITGNFSENGVYFYYSDNLTCIFNNINVFGEESSNSSSIELYYSNNIELFNNIISNKKQTYALYVYNGSEIHSNNNCYYTNGDNIAYINGIAETLADLQKLGNGDNSSLNLDPGFVSNTNLHVQNYFFNANALPFSYVTEDIDGDKRNLSSPDIGADEFDLLGIDAGILSINPLGEPLQNIKVNLMNYATDTLRNVTIHWEMDSIIQEEYNWTGLLSTGESQSLVIGQANYPLGSSYSTKVWTLYPNESEDLNHKNDTAFITSNLVRYKGVYSIGGIDPDFVDFNSAIDSITKYGISDQIIFKVRDGEYNEQLVINEIEGADDLNSIVFESESGDSTNVTLFYECNGSSDNYVVLLNEVDGITFRNMRIRSVNSSYSRIFNIDDNVDNLKITNCILEAPVVSSSSSDYAIIYSFNASNENIEISNNIFLNGSTAIYYYGSSSAYINDLIIHNNICQTQYANGFSLGYIESPRITSNKITNTTYNSAYGINLNYCRNNTVIEKNDISNNGRYGINMSNCHAANNPGYIFNNFIHVGGSQSGSAIRLYSCSYQEILFNNLFSNSLNTNGSALNINGHHISILNNNIINTVGYAFYVNDDVSVFTQCDYNNIYADTLFTGKIGRIDNVIINSITDWKANGIDAHSLTVDPLFVADTNLHIREIALDKAGIAFQDITTDYDNEPRHPETPDIGADEFSNYLNNVGITKIYPNKGCGLSDYELITVTIRNYGELDQTGFDVTYSINSGTLITENIDTLIIPAGQSVNYSFNNTYDFNYDKDYHIIAYTSLTGDQEAYDDTLEVSITNKPPFDLTVESDNIICTGQGANLSAYGASIYNWSNGRTSSTIYVEPLATTVYYVTATNVYECDDNDSIKVIVNPLPEKPVITADGELEFCNGEFVNLSSNISTNIQWSNDEITPSITVNTSGSFYAIHTDLNNCFSYSDTITVVEDVRPSIIKSINSTICQGDTIILSSSGALSYNWSTGEVIENIFVWPSDTTEYSLITETNMGCTYYDTIIVDVYPDVQSGEITYVIPENNAGNQLIPVHFSWEETENATLYDLYVWNKDSIEPEIPVVENIYGLSYDYSGEAFSYGDTVLWKMIAKNACHQSEGPVQQFATRKLPELHVSSVSTSEVNSGSTIDVTWTVVNDGEGVTIEGEWYDRIWFTPYIGFNSYASENELLGIFQNPTSLNPGESYQQTKQVTLPEDLIGTYYLFVITDALDVFNINYEGNTNPPVPYNPPPYWSGKSIRDNFPQVDYIKEVSDYRPPPSGHTYVYNDNFYYIELNFPAPPLPDLLPTTITIPENIFSGEFMNISWTVTNIGDKNLNSAHWSDRIYLSVEEELNINNAILLGTYPYSNALLINESYAKNIQVKLPVDIYGGYYIYIISDCYDNVFEHLNESNNTLRSERFNIVLSPPPDLIVQEVMIPDSAYNSQNIIIEWNVLNQGAAVPVGSSWYDKISLSKNAEYNLYNAIYLKRTKIWGTLEADSAYNRSLSIRIPDEINGNYYIYIETDYSDKVFEHNNENNNILRSTTPLIIQSPDLIVENIDIIDSLNSGEMVQIEWQVKNIGKGRLLNKTIYDEIYISEDSIFSLANAILITEDFRMYSLLNNQSIVRTKIITIPNGISGDYYFHIQTDSRNDLFEAVETNNISTTNNKQVALTDWPDLIPLSISVSDTLIAGTDVSIKYSAINNGLGIITSNEWSDEFYISKYSSLDENAISLKEIIQEKNINSTESYSDSIILNIPYNLTSGYYYIYFNNDSKNNIYEHTDEWNNVLRTVQVYVEEHPPIDLSIKSFSVPDSANSGTPTRISYTVENIGSFKTIAPGWDDAIYISTDTIINESDIKLHNWRIILELKPSEKYAKSQNITIPNGIEGDYYLILVTDRKNNHLDINLTNNKKTQHIPVILSASPDLELSIVDIPSNIKTGEPFNIVLNVINNGNTALVNIPWVDKIVLSDDNIIDNSDEELFSKTRNSIINVGEAYTDTAEINLPHNYEGNYYIIVKTDYKNNIYEHLSEDNNEVSSIVLVTKTPATDIIVSEIISPPEIIVTESITIDWTIKNIGDIPVEAYVKDLVCLSKDTLWDASDPIIGDYYSEVNLLQMQETTRSISENLNTASIGENYIIIKTDVHNTIYEINDTNNTSYSGSILVKTEELELGITKDAVLYNNQPKYYQLEIDSIYSGETLLTTLKGDSLFGNNELYIKYGDLPTRVDYDFKYQNHFSGDQEVLIPELQEGMYYFMVYGATSSSAEQNISILSEILPFKILSINSNTGGNTGKVTVKLTGSKFEENMQIRIEGIDTIVAEKSDLIDNSNLFATFDLKNAQTGLCDLVLINSKIETAKLEDSFTIEAGNSTGDGTGTSSGSLSLTCINGTQNTNNINFDKYFNIQPEVRPNRIFSFQIYFINNSNADIPIPIRILTSVDNAPISLTPEDLDSMDTEITLEFKEVNGPNNILRPDVEGYITIYSKSITPTNTNILRYRLLK